MIDDKLLKILACPQCQSELEMDATGPRLICRAEALAYPIRDGIPILLIEEAQAVDKEDSK